MLDEARTDFLDARMRLAHALKSEGASASDIAAALSTTLDEALLVLDSDPEIPVPGSMRSRLVRSEMRAEQIARELEGTMRRLARANDDQLATLLDMDRLRRKTSAAPARMCED